MKTLVTFFIFLGFTLQTDAVYGIDSASENFAQQTIHQESLIFLSSFISTEQKKPSLESIYSIESQTGSLEIESGNALTIDQGVDLLADAHHSEELPLISDEMIGEEVMPDQMSEEACDYFKTNRACCHSTCETDSCSVDSNECQHGSDCYDCCGCCCECCCEDEEGGGYGGGTSTTGGGGSSGFFTGISSGGSSGGSSSGTDTTGTDTTGTDTDVIIPEPQTYFLLATTLLLVLYIKRKRQAFHKKSNQ